VGKQGGEMFEHGVKYVKRNFALKRILQFGRRQPYPRNHKTKAAECLSRKRAPYSQVLAGGPPRANHLGQDQGLRYLACPVGSWALPPSIGSATEPIRPGRKKLPLSQKVAKSKKTSVEK